MHDSETCQWTIWGYTCRQSRQLIISKSISWKLVFKQIVVVISWTACNPVMNSTFDTWTTPSRKCDKDTKYYATNRELEEALTKEWRIPNASTVAKRLKSWRLHTGVTGLGHPTAGQFSHLASICRPRPQRKVNILSKGKLFGSEICGNPHPLPDVQWTTLQRCVITSPQWSWWFFPTTTR